MKRIVGVLGASVAALALVALAIAAVGTNESVHLQGRYEVPAVTTTGQGHALFQIADDGSSVDFQLIVAGLQGITQSHIHCGAPEVNGPVVVFLYGFNPAGVTLNGTLNEGTFTDAEVIDRPDSAACPGGVSSLEDVLAKIAAGQAYVNVHTIEFPGGEVRGNF